MKKRKKREKKTAAVFACCFIVAVFACCFIFLCFLFFPPTIQILKAIHVSHQGLTESEITNIFKIQSNVWSPFYFAMEYFIVSYLGNFGFVPVCFLCM